MNNEVAVVPPQEVQKQNLSAPTMAETLMVQAIDKGVSVETMEKLMAMRRELRAEQAKEQFDMAMAKFQGECPVIKKKKEGGKTNSGTVAYYYAPLDIIVEQTRDLIKNNGLSYSVETLTTKTDVKVTVTAKHISGHSESSTFEVPMATKTGVMSNPQVVAASITFAKRYAFCNVFGILTGDDDIDANKKKPVAAPIPSTPAKQEVCVNCAAIITPAEAKYSMNIKKKKLCRVCQNLK